MLTLLFFSHPISLLLPFPAPSSRPSYLAEPTTHSTPTPKQVEQPGTTRTTIQLTSPLYQTLILRTQILQKLERRERDGRRRLMHERLQLRRRARSQVDNLRTLHGKLDILGKELPLLQLLQLLRVMASNHTTLRPVQVREVMSARTTRYSPREVESKGSKTN